MTSSLTGRHCYCSLADIGVNRDAVVRSRIAAWVIRGAFGINRDVVRSRIAASVNRDAFGINRDVVVRSRTTLVLILGAFGINLFG